MNYRVSKLQMQNPTTTENKINQLLKEKEGVYISGQADFAKMTLHKHKTLTIWITYVFSVSDDMNAKKTNETFFYDNINCIQWHFAKELHTFDICNVHILFQKWRLWITNPIVLPVI